jgi:uncharacterized protein involved in exopolysaccharide biosynthesis
VPRHERTADTILLSEYLRPVYQDRWRVLCITLAGGALLYALSFLVPPTYLAATTVIPVGNQDKTSLLGQIGSGLEDLGIQTGSKSNSPAMYPDIVRSRRLVGEVLDLPSPPEVDSRRRPLLYLLDGPNRDPRSWDKAIRRARRMVASSVDRRTGVLTIEVRARRPEIAALMANALDSLLQQFTIQASSSQASANRVFIEGRLAETDASLHQAEENLRDFRERNLRIMNAPNLLMEEARLVRLLRAEEEVFVTLKRQYEMAKIQEHKDLPVLTILDPAVTPVSRDSPKRGLMAASGLLVGLMFGSWLAMLRAPRVG